MRYSAPNSFTVEGINENCKENWALALSNLKQIVREMKSIFPASLGKNFKDIDDIDLKAIGMPFCYSFYLSINML